jgi:DNA modification methylase
MIRAETTPVAHAPGSVRDAIIAAMSKGNEFSVADIQAAVRDKIGEVSPSSVRSYLNLNVPETFERTGRGKYRLKKKLLNGHTTGDLIALGKAKLHKADCFLFLAETKACSIHAVVTDPPYGLVEYTEKEQAKLREGRGGVWRIPPSFDGHKRAPLPRFTVLDKKDHERLHAFFKRFSEALTRVLVPGGNVVVASNPLLCHIVADAMSEGGLELRGHIVRLTMTMRGGDRPKNAHQEFDGISVMPRSMWEPWVILRKPIEGRVQDNLRKWGTGGFRRPSADQPFGDVIKSNPTRPEEKRIAPHPSLKPQEFLRKLVRAALPLGKGIVLDPFAGSGSTLAAANALGYASVGVEKDESYFEMAIAAIPRLAELNGNSAPSLPVMGEVDGKPAKRSNAAAYPKGRRSHRETNGRVDRSILRAGEHL